MNYTRVEYTFSVLCARYLKLVFDFFQFKSDKLKSEFNSKSGPHGKVKTAR